MLLSQEPASVNPSVDAVGTLEQLWQAVASHRWGIAAVIGAMLLTAFARFIAPRIHGTLGKKVNGSRVSVLLALANGFLMAVTAQLLKGGKWSPTLLAYGFAAGLGAIGGYNAFWDIFFPDDQPPVSLEGAEVQPPRPPRQRGAVRLVVLMLLAAVGFALCLPGCAFARCELGKLPKASQIVLAEVVGVLAQPQGVDWEGELKTIGLQLLPGQLDCVVEALATAEAPSGGLKAARDTPTRALIRARLAEWRSKHPAASCIERRAA